MKQTKLKYIVSILLKVIAQNLVREGNGASSCPMSGMLSHTSDTNPCDTTGCMLIILPLCFPNSLLVVVFQQKATRIRNTDAKQLYAVRKPGTETDSVLFFYCIQSVGKIEIV